MKFKALFVLFNIVLILSFLTIFLLPFFLLDASFMLEFWKRNWYFGAIFLAVLATVNGLFLSQWKLLSFLEREDWPALARLLESRVVGKRRFSKRQVRLYCDSLILLGDFDGIRRLRETLESARPRLFSRFATRFAAASVLAGDYDRAHEIASAAGAPGDTEDGEWRRFYASFSRHLARHAADAAEGMIDLASRARDPLVAVLSGYLCASSLAVAVASRKDELIAASEEAKLRVGAVFTQDRWARYVEEAKADMQVVILGKLISEASSWLFGAQGASR